MVSRTVIIEAIRKAAAEALGVESLSEAGNGPELQDQPREFGAYKVGECERIEDPASVGLAVLDQPVLIPIDFYYVRQRAMGSEAMGQVRDRLDALSEALGDAGPVRSAWREGLPVVWSHVTSFGEGGSDEYGHVFLSGDNNWCAGHVSVEVLCA
ncbi:MAG TPA: hypothetical protein VGM37_01385 [Armatimonadota bacterium]|jgi:hypothetical protein